MRLRGLLLLSVFICSSLFIPSIASADIGVGVGTGKIAVDEQLESGGIYTLPQIIVYNTGDETATYAMQLTLNETQDELKPAPEWFSFSPKNFELEPGKSELVTPMVTIPVNAEGGDYFGYLEAYPDATIDRQGAAIGVAAATKLSFSVEPSSSFSGIINRLIALYLSNAPLTYIVTALIILTSIILLLRKYVRFNVTVAKKKSKKEDSDEEDTA